MIISSVLSFFQVSCHGLWILREHLICCCKRLRFPLFEESWNILHCKKNVRTGAPCDGVVMSFPIGCVDPRSSNLRLTCRSLLDGPLVLLHLTWILRGLLIDRKSRLHFGMRCKCCHLQLQLFCHTPVLLFSLTYVLRRGWILHCNACVFLSSCCRKRCWLSCSSLWNGTMAWTRRVFGN